MSNRLALETSPYLLQHKDNAVDWYPWGPEALTRARAEQKPIFLSIGYAACHWCHVMEHESFDNPEIAAFLNARFISIKVDREERPDLDQIYMTAVQIMTRHGGWPMSVFLTPDLQPFYGGTYWPPYPRMGMPGFIQVIQGVDELWRTRRDEAVQQAAQLTQYLQRSDEPESGRFGRRPAAVSGGGRAVGARIRCGPRRVRLQAQISARDGAAILAADVAADRTRRPAEDGAAESGQNGVRRDLRSPGRRLCPLCGRRTLAGAAL